MTVLEVIQRSTEFLNQRGVDSPRLQTELILAHVLQMPRLKLYLNFQRELTEGELTQTRAFVKRRGQREPLQYILGTWSFCGLEIKCSAAALIPRPETELLVERAVQSLSAARSESPVVLDIGTGTGCIPIAIATKVPGSRAVAVDVSPEALSLARDNATRHQLTDRIEFRLGSDFAPLSAEERFDLVVSNPPYIPSADIATLQPEVQQHEPRLALDGGADGLDVFRTIAAKARVFLKPAGKFIGEFSDGQAAALKNVFEREKWIVEEIVDDYSSRPRILIARPE